VQKSEDFIKSSHPKFYKIAESFYNCMFKNLDDGTGVVSEGFKNFTVGIRINPKEALDLYINENKIEDPKLINLTELFIMEAGTLKGHLKNLLENLDMVGNVPFIKEVINERLGKKAYIIQIEDKFHVCEAHANSLKREWKEFNEYKLYKYMLETFNYDISGIYGMEINDEVQKIKQIDEHKLNLETKIKKLQTSVDKINTTLESGRIEEAHLNEFETLRDNILSAITELKGQHKELELDKKKELTL